MQENSIFTVTPPDIRLSEYGPSITVISSNVDFITEIDNMYEQMFKTVPVTIYHPNGPVKDDNKLAWLLSVINISDTVFVDLATASEISILTIALVECNVVLINRDHARPDIVKLCNSTKEGIAVYDSLEDYFNFVLLIGRGEK